MGTSEDDEAVAMAILSYLAEHPQAMDSAEGIAQWWTTRQSGRGSASTIARVLDGLVQRGLIEELGDCEHHRYGLKRRRSPS